MPVLSDPPISLPALEQLRDRACDPDAMTWVEVVHYARIATNYCVHAMAEERYQDAEVYAQFAADLLRARLHSR